MDAPFKRSSSENDFRNRNLTLLMGDQKNFKRNMKDHLETQKRMKKLNFEWIIPHIHKINFNQTKQYHILFQNLQNTVDISVSEN